VEEGLKGNMTRGLWHKAVMALFGPALFLFAGNALAASLAKIEVASHLGEPFYAEVPVKLASDELASRILVEIASPSDYKIFEVYRDPVLSGIRADVASDDRGVRVKLSSGSNIKSPFFNLILKIRSGRVSHFKKFPVFLDVEQSVQRAVKQKPQPSVQAVNANIVPSSMSATESAGQVVSSGEVSIPEVKSSPDVEEPANPHFAGWARTGRYGPIVRGDSLSTVARRLMVDNRYSLSQVRLALFEKNRSSFAQDNMNLLKKDSFLDVPTADEVEQHSAAEASLAFLEHEKKWHELIQQPRYAAEAEAQRTRYTKHISVGEHADGVAAAPVVVRETAEVKEKSVLPSTAEVTPSDAAATVAAPVVQNPAEETASGQNQTAQMVARLQEENRLLKQQLGANQQNIEMLTQQIDDVATPATNARIDKLELLITHLQNELEKAHAQRPASLFGGMDWIIWLLVGLLVVLLGTIALLLRREPAHPASSAQVPDKPSPELTDAEDTAALSVMTGVAHDGGTAAADSLSDPGDEPGDTTTTDASFIGDDSDNLSSRDTAVHKMEDVDFDTSDFDVSDIRPGQDGYDQAPFDVEGSDETEEIDWLLDASFDDEDSDSPIQAQEDAVAPDAERESNEMEEFSLESLQDSGDPLAGAMDQADETVTAMDEEESIRHLDSLLSKLEEDQSVIADEGAGLGIAATEASDDEILSMDLLDLDDEPEQGEAQTLDYQLDELNDNEDDKKD